MVTLITFSMRVCRPAKLRDEQRFRYDLAGLVMRGWIAPERLRAGRVLSDADRR